MVLVRDGLPPMRQPNPPPASCQFSLVTLTPPPVVPASTEASPVPEAPPVPGLSGSGVSMVASQFTNVTTLWFGKSKVKLSVAVIGVLAARLSVSEVTQA